MRSFRGMGLMVGGEVRVLVVVWENTQLVAIKLASG